MKQAETLDKEQTTELSCPVSKQGRRTFKTWVKRLGWAGFFFFLVKGLLWLIIPYLIAKGLF
ncbi:MAG: hypothetical protein KBB37_06995 [Bacteroidia bacterium]|jgi:hypothetical protein|nr:hypothetical protein [Bacteroidia bacterium]MBP7261015.1 hypothetical protein [Bacteroidia bacterium]MBP9179244.1 hypothetical protein [Bacteroidia bacterium]MBP9724334.1 hypothetical protein [Bacteroidia bacterium]